MKFHETHSVFDYLHLADKEAALKVATSSITKLQLGPDLEHRSVELMRKCSNTKL